MQVTWDNVEELEAYIAKLKKAADQLSIENRQLRRCHLNISDKVRFSWCCLSSFFCCVQTWSIYFIKTVFLYSNVMLIFETYYCFISCSTAMTCFMGCITLLSCCHVSVELENCEWEKFSHYMYSIFAVSQSFSDFLQNLRICKISGSVEIQKALCTGPLLWYIGYHCAGHFVKFNFFSWH